MDQSQYQSQQSQVPSYQDQGYITFILESTQQKWKVDSRLINFSHFLKTMFEESQLKDGYNSAGIELPSFLKVDEKVLELIKQFHSVHNYQKESIKITKIKTTGWFNSLDSESLLFAETHLEVQSEQMIKRLLNACEYLKLNLLKEVICVFIASKHYHCYNQIKMEKDLEEMNVFYSRQMDINLKRSLLGYARQLSKDLMEKIQIKQQKKKETNKS